MNQLDLFEDKSVYYQKAISSVGEEWANKLWEEFQKDYMKQLKSFLTEELKTYKIYPEMKNVFRAYKETPFNEVKVVIIGQDPYPHGAADGLAFSSKKGDFYPPSLKRIFTEVNKDMEGMHFPSTPDLTNWAKQGVFLLNKVLTVRYGEPKSHHKKGWEQFVEATIQAINTMSESVVFLLWGSEAKSFDSTIDKTKHIVLKTSHPAREESYNMGFRNCQHFKRTNEYLREYRNTEIQW